MMKLFHMKQFTTACREKLTHGTPVGKAIIDYRKVMFSCTLLDMYLIKPKKQHDSRKLFLDK
jgi:hypothetical protein